jgi:hypothetical protein
MPVEYALGSMRLISSELLPQLRKVEPLKLEDFRE